MSQRKIKGTTPPVITGPINRGDSKRSKKAKATSKRCKQQFVHDPNGPKGQLIDHIFGRMFNVRKR